MYFFPFHLNGKDYIACAKSLPLCLTLCDPIDCSPPCSSVHGIFQARVLEQIAFSSSRGIFPTQGSNPRLLHWQAGSFSLVPSDKARPGGGQHAQRFALGTHQLRSVRQQRFSEADAAGRAQPLAGPRPASPRPRDEAAARGSPGCGGSRSAPSG